MLQRFHATVCHSLKVIHIILCSPSGKGFNAISKAGLRSNFVEDDSALSLTAGGARQGTAVSAAAPKQSR